MLPNDHSPLSQDVRSGPLSKTLLLLFLLAVSTALVLLVARRRGGIVAGQRRPHVAMSSSSKTSKEALIRQFRSITNATQNDASRILKQNGYRLEASVDAFYGDQSAMAAAGKASGTGAADRKAEKEQRQRLNTLFDRYADEGDKDRITIEGAMQMCEDLEITPDDVAMLPLSFYLRSPSLGTFERDRYVDGWRTIAGGDATRCDTLEAQQALLPRLREEIQRDAPVRGELGMDSKRGLFHRVYEFTYTFARPDGQKSLPLDSAVAFWDVLIPYAPAFGTGPEDFTQRQLNLWKTFLATKHPSRAISKDTWILFLDFTGEIDADFANHDVDAAWPSQIDEFVEWAKDQPPEAGLHADAMDES